MHSGTWIGPYKIAAPIGAGGMGEVSRARDRQLNRDVTVKVLPNDFVADADRLRRFEFEQEAKTRAALNHPNVLTIHDGGVHDGALYLVSELLEGKTLCHRIRLVQVAERKSPPMLRMAIAANVSALGTATPDSLADAACPSRGGEGGRNPQRSADSPLRSFGDALTRGSR